MSVSIPSSSINLSIHSQGASFVHDIIIKATITPPERSVSFSIINKDPGVNVRIAYTWDNWEKEFYVSIEKEKNSESGYFTLRAEDPQNPNCCFIEKRLEVDTDCNCVGQCSPGSGVPSLSSIDATFSLGKTNEGDSAGELYIYAKTPSPDLSTPKTLGISSFAKQVKTITMDNSDVIRQIVSPQSIVDVVTNSAFSYSIKFYKLSDVLKKGCVNCDRLYTFKADAIPFVTWNIENPDASVETYNKLRMTKIKSSNSYVYEYLWDETKDIWSLSSGNGLKIETIEEEIDGNNRIVTKTTKDDSGKVVSKTQTVFHKFPWGESVISRVEDPDGDTLTTTMNYYEDISYPGSYKRVKSVINPDGSWIRYEYDSEGREARTVSSWLDAPVTSLPEKASEVIYDYTPLAAADTREMKYRLYPRKIVEKVLGTVVSLTYHVYATNTLRDRIEIVERCSEPTASYGDQNNERTVTNYHEFNPDDFRSGKIRSVQYPDGRLDTYTYEKGTYTTNENPALNTFTAGDGSDTQTTLINGTVPHPSGIAYKTTIEVTVQNNLGYALMRETYVYTGSNYSRVRWTVSKLDELGRTVKIINSDGTESENNWNCCGKEFDIDSRGIKTSYIYDDLKRIKSSVKEGISSGTWPAQANITTSYTYDAAGRTLTTTITSSGLIQVSENEYTTTGRLLNVTDPAGFVTSYTYDNSARMSAVVKPGGITEITTLYIDGQTKSITGTGVVAMYYEYGVNADGTQWTKTYTGSENSPMWEKTTVDILGRNIKTERPGYTGIVASQSYYNKNGQLIRSSATGQADRLYEYDELGSQIRNGLDIDGNGILENNSNDQISENERYYTKTGGTWWNEGVQYVYAKSLDDSTTLVSTNRTQMNELGIDGKTQEQVSIDIFGNETIAQSFVDRSKKTVTQKANYPDSSTDAVSISVNGLLVSTSSKTGIETTYVYDDLGRRTGVTDPRTGTSITNYNSKGQVGYVQDSAVNKTSYTYDENTGQIIIETNALGKSVRYSYNDHGQVTHIWGDTAYPVKYEYDTYGRKSAMYTYRSGTNWSSDTWPTGLTGSATKWHYQESTGFLTSKEDAAGKAVTYSYTADGKVKTRTWARKDGENPIVTTYSYSEKTGALLSIAYPDSSVAFTYDRLGRKETVTDKVGTRTFAYNTALQLKSETITGLYSKTITRSYSPDGVKGRSTGFSIGTGYSATYGYDTSGRFSTLEWNVGTTTGKAAYSYLANSNLLHQITTESGKKTTYAYELKRNLKTQVKNEYGSQLISQYGYTYDAVGRRENVANSGAAFASSRFNRFGYNDRSELTESSRYQGSNVNDLTNPIQSEYRKYGYNPIGNRKEITAAANTGSYTSNNLNQYNQYTVGSNTSSLSYDDDGNLIKINDGAKDVEYTYNAENRLITVTPLSPVDGDKKIECTYDYIGRRVQKKVFVWNTGSWALETEKLFVYDGWNLGEEITKAGSTEATKFYVWGLDISQSLQGAGGIAGLVASVEGSNTYYFLYDGNGNVGQLINGSGSSIAAQYEYDPSGNILFSAGTQAHENTFRFSTKYLDIESELYYYGYRYYSSALGRWINRDPAKENGGLNLYGFVLNNSVDSIDSLGLWKIFPYSGHEQLVEESFRRAEKFCCATREQKSELLEGLIEGVREPDIPEGYHNLVGLRGKKWEHEGWLTYLSHYGHLQYWHAMQSYEGSANQIKSRIIKLVMSRVRLFKQVISYKAKGKIIGFAFHTIQDSYSRSHVIRDYSSAIEQFQNYNKQDSMKHSAADKSKDTLGHNRAIQAVAKILEYICSEDESLIRSYLDNDVLKLAPGAVAGGTDEFYEPDPAD